MHGVIYSATPQMTNHEAIKVITGGDKGKCQIGTDRRLESYSCIVVFRRPMLSTGAENPTKMVKLNNITYQIHFIKKENKN